MMLSSKRSIFHVGEEGGDDTAIRIHAKKKILGHHRVTNLPGRIRSPADGHVGLRIVINQHMQGSNIVLKPMVNPCKFKELLKACYLCRKLLSPNMDVYMYRGDLGFCSEECRCQQILSDEKVEAATKRKRLGLNHHHRQQANKSNVNPTYHHKKILLTA
ncbi:hypothetical protein LUZ62_071495 [Rhynchospora pubera]|uniref:FLZ-type domain-containing protein n=1 Tax=Rhynchospora pubera TaxID=906938 RepID=A0AAV8CY90_9POAL|nr:hypothetical protein LUZ62_071495 [Rhynchospora pubera]